MVWIQRNGGVCRLWRGGCGFSLVSRIVVVAVGVGAAVGFAVNCQAILRNALRRLLFRRSSVFGLGGAVASPSGSLYRRRCHKKSHLEHK